MTRDEVHALVISFPNTEEGTSYGKPAFKAFGKFFTRIRVVDDSVVLGCVSYDEREMLCEADPATFHFTDHYKSYDYVLARIETLEPLQLRGFLTRQWRKNAPKAWLKKYDAEHKSELF
jgi:hypothetical protein